MSGVVGAVQRHAHPEGMTEGATAVLTYRNLRLSILGIVAFLFAGTGWVIASGEVLPSISASYFTPAGPVFVGSLVAVALALGTLSGTTVRRMLLSLAAITAPLIALIPTTLGSDAYRALTGEPCAGGAERCVGPDVHDSIAAGMTAGVVVAVLALGAVLIAAIVQRSRDPKFWVRLALTVVLAAGFVVWYLVDGGPSGSFETAGHVVATALFFGLIAAVAAVHAIVVLVGRSGSGAASAAHPRRWGIGYLVLAAAILVTITVNVVLLVAEERGVDVGATWGPMWFYALEVTALGLFAVFWTAQTIEYWRVADGSTPAA